MLGLGFCIYLSKLLLGTLGCSLLHRKLCLSFSLLFLFFSASIGFSFLLSSDALTLLLRLSCCCRGFFGFTIGFLLRGLLFGNSLLLCQLSRGTVLFRLLSFEFGLLLLLGYALVLFLLGYPLVFNSLRFSLLGLLLLFFNGCETSCLSCFSVSRSFCIGFSFGFSLCLSAFLGSSSL